MFVVQNYDISAFVLLYLEEVSLFSHRPIVDFETPGIFDNASCDTLFSALNFRSWDGKRAFLFAPDEYLIPARSASHRVTGKKDDTYRG